MRDALGRPLLLILISAALLAGSAVVLRREPPGLPAFQKPPLEDFALLDVSMAVAGLRRLGADLAFIQMLQYYASEEGESGEGGGQGGAPSDQHEGVDEHGHVHVGAGEGQADIHPEIRLTQFPRLYDHCLRIVSLDPYFHYAVLFGAGALAFNLNRDDEALRLLRAGAESDPTYWQYRLYAGAIGFRKSADLDKVVVLLEEAVRYPDCPTMLENILANIYKKQGRLDDAARTYARILETGRDPAYVAAAHKNLEALRARGISIEGE